MTDYRVSVEQRSCLLLDRWTWWPNARRANPQITDTDDRVIASPYGLTSPTGIGINLKRPKSVDGISTLLISDQMLSEALRWNV